jgi:hypothetical protein
MKNRCKCEDDIKMNLQGIELGLGLDTSGRGHGEGGGCCFNNVIFFGSIKRGIIFD